VPSRAPASKRCMHVLQFIPNWDWSRTFYGTECILKGFDISGSSIVSLMVLGNGVTLSLVPIPSVMDTFVGDGCAGTYY
jgi:hypothetical protein